ncbi:MAG: dihydrofolate reductase [Treponema sp.]|jgi:dihydrofolate reductase|nr:dihydrofolate reductase [Treponema sp.]
MEIIIIAAMSGNGAIGKDNALPWSIKEDIIHFKKLTSGFPCIMGRKTWESLPRKPLPGRLKIIISSTLKIDAAENVKVCSTLDEGIALCGNAEKIFICGGAMVYNEAVKIADKIELTLVHKTYDGDAFFPKIDPALWEKTDSTDTDIFSFITYTKKMYRK